MNIRACVIRPILRIMCLLACIAAAGTAAASPPRGSAAPPISLKDLDGQVVLTEKLAPRALVLVFGEMSHPGTREACADVMEVMSDPKFAGGVAVPILVVAQAAPPSQLKEEAAKGRYPPVVLQDSKREAFGAYHVLVIPTIVVVDGKGKVVYSMPAYLKKSKSLLTEAILTATGKESQEQFDQAVDPKAPSETHETVRADRLVNLGEELARHGLFEMAVARFTEATALVPGHVGATLGLGNLMLRQERLAEAEPLFRSVLATHPDSAEASLGIASVQIRRGDDIDTAQATVQGIIDRDPKQSRARYLMGLIQERRGDTAAAAAQFKRAAELLMDR